MSDVVSREPDPPSSATTARVLVVDDDYEVRRILGHGLAQAGFVVELADGGRAALDVLDRVPVDLVVADLRMPGMSGLELAAALRKREATATLPFILLTGSPADESLIPGLEAGADEFLSKPVRMSDLVARIRAHLRSAGNWAALHESDIRRRIEVAESLREAARGPRDGAAVRIVQRLAASTLPAYASLYQVTAEQMLRPLAVSVGGAEPVIGGQPVIPRRARFLLDHAREGARVEHLPQRFDGEPDQGFWQIGVDLVGLGPIYSGERLVAILFIGIKAESSPGTSLQQARLLAAISDYAQVLSVDFGPALAAEVRLDTEHRRLSSILEERAFSVVYQPVQRLTTGEVVGYEALARFIDGERPDIRFAEATAAGLGMEFEMAALDRALEGAAQLPNHLFIAVNVSPAVILRGGSAIRGILEARRCPTTVIEVTEHAPIADYAEFRAASAALPSVRLAIDDAGAGYSSLRHILELRPAFAKLDISLVRDVQDDAVRQALIAGLVSAARASGFELIAEGIEHAAELETLRGLGVTLGQGYLLGMPGDLPA